MNTETRKESIADCETGEVLAIVKINEETGEEECNYKCPIQRRPTKRIFKVPSIYLTEIEELPSKITKSTLESGSVFPIIMFLLPTAFFFNPFIVIVLFMIETSLHTWAHKINNKLRDSPLYYESPMHALVSHFCAACREEESADKINKIQEHRNKLKGCGIECVRQIVT